MKSSPLVELKPYGSHRFHFAFHPVVNVDPSVNSASQKHSRFRLMTVARRMGCKARVNKQSEVPEIVIQLIAPLVFPAANKPPAKRR